MKIRLYKSNTIKMYFMNDKIFRYFQAITILSLSFMCFCVLIMNTLSQQATTGNNTEERQNQYYSLSHIRKKLSSKTSRDTSGNSTLTTKFLIDSDVCKIPDVNPFDDSIKHLLIKSPRVVDCSRNIKIFTYVRNNILYLNATDNITHVSYCRYKAIYKHNKSFKYGNESAKFNSSITVFGEFLKVECFDSADSLIAEHFHIQFVKKLKEQINRSRLHNMQLFNKTQLFKPLPNSLQSDSDNVKSLPDVFNSFNDATKDSTHLNVLLIMLDSTSRINSLRYLLKTRKYLSETLEAVELLGYNKVADNTMVNMVPFLTGEPVDELPCLKDKHGVDNCTFIWKRFAELGYVTHFAEDWNWAGIFNFNMPGFKYQPTDYYDHPFHGANEKGAKSRFETCFHGKSSSQVLHDRMFDLVSKLGQTPYFSLSVHSRMTHDLLSGAFNIDNMTTNVLSALFQNNLLNNTFLAVFGDHGMRFGPVRSSFVGHIEERLPMMFIYLPKWFKAKYYNYFKNLNINSKRLTTHFDMHSTVAHLLNLDEQLTTKSHKYGISLFKEIPPNRSCQDAGIPPHWCTCNYHLIAHNNVTTSSRIAKSVVIHLNKLLRKFKQKCRKLKLADVHSCIKLSRNSNSDEHEIVIKTNPGGGLFEATVIYNKSSEVYDVIGDISRINKYSGQSDCIQNKIIRKICFCRK